MKLFINILIIAFFEIGCQNLNNKDKNQIITFNLNELPRITNIKLSDLNFVDIEYIPLESNEHCMIPMINDIIVGDSYFLTHFFSKIYKFQTNGSFITKIGTEGRGPNEFTIVHDVDIDKKNHYIYLVSGWQKKFYIYSEGGEFIRTFQCPHRTTDFRVTEDGILCYNINSFADVETSYNLIDIDGRIIKNFPNKYLWHLVQRDTYVFEFENIFYRFNNRLFKKEVYSDTVYVFENIDFKPHLVIELGKRLITTKARSNSSPEQIMDNFIAPINLFEFGDFIYYEFIVSLNNHREQLSFIGSKKNDFQVLVDPEKDIINDLDGGPNIWPKAIKDDNTVISWIDAINIKNHVSSEAFKNSTPKYPEKKKELEKIANNLKETDNPVLMMVRLKK
jgi:hypothetical protein